MVGPGVIICHSQLAREWPCQSVAVVVAVAAVVPVVAAAVGKRIINMATTTATVINGGSELGRWSDCTGQRPKVSAKYR